VGEAPPGSGGGAGQGPAALGGTCDQAPTLKDVEEEKWARPMQPAGSEGTVARCDVILAGEEPRMDDERTEAAATAGLRQLV